jgi:flagellar basal-body rod protein FlgC
MQDPLQSALRISASGLEAQSRRLRVVTENLANAQSTAKTPGGDPYTRRVVTFENEVDEAAGTSLVKVSSIERHRSPYRLEHNPGHPAADANGYVKMPNVDVMSEVADMHETNRSYEANLQVIKQAREMISMTIDMLRSV